MISDAVLLRAALRIHLINVLNVIVELQDGLDRGPNVLDVDVLAMLCKGWVSVIFSGIAG